MSDAATITVTTNERKVLRAIRFNDYGNSDPFAEVWAMDINASREDSGIEGRALSAVCSSLAQKGLVGTSGKGREAVIWLTPTGLAASE